jgi:hypothetical protein
MDSISGESDIVGTTDLSTLEKSFGLTKDVQVNGKWARSEETLRAGECYSDYLGSGAKDPQNWQFRRYKTGAAFFRKANTGANTGDKRPIACLDLDGGDEGPYSLDGFALDAGIRYKLGKPAPFDLPDPNQYLTFSTLSVEVKDALHFCVTEVEEGEGAGGLAPGYKAYGDAKKKCVAEKGADCTNAARNACVWWTTLDARADSMDRPSWRDFYVVTLDGEEKLSNVQMMLAYKYSLAKGKQSDLFSLGDDPVGAYVSVEGSGNLASGATVAHFAHLDVHHVFAGGKEGVYVTPKSSDKSIAKSAVASCERTIDAKNVATGLFTCKGI